VPPTTATPATSPSTSRALARDRDGAIRQASRCTQRSTSSTAAAATSVATPPRIRASQRARWELVEASATDATTRSASSSPGRAVPLPADDLAAKPSPATST
jgi:hypothetical protein